MKIIITEKPSVTKDFAKALSCTFKDGVYSSKEYKVTNAIGHLLELCEPSDYDSSLSKWSLETLPIIPDKIRYKPIEKTKQQLDVIKKLLSAQDFEKLIIATDAGREGELIARLVLFHCQLSNWNNVYRFWVSEALTPDVVKRGLDNIRPASNYDALYKAGRYRQLSDWVLGINISRLLSIKFKTTCSFGRVQTAVLSMIGHRDNHIKNFQPEKYFQLYGNFAKKQEQFNALYQMGKSERFPRKSDLEFVAKLLNNQNKATIIDVREREKISKAPPLYNLTALQRTANKQYGFPAQKTLGICQSLYEKHKCLSYPRTPSRVLGESNVQMVKDIITKLRKDNPLISHINQNYINTENKHVFNDSKLEDHHALIPLSPIPSETTNDESKIYDLVLRSFIAVFTDPYIYNSIQLTLKVKNFSFQTTGTKIKQQGWVALRGEEKDEEENETKNSLPSLTRGEEIDLSGYEILEKKTKPKPQFTEATILGAMEHPEQHSQSENSEYKFTKEFGLGTQATRGSIIETLIKRELIERNSKKLIPTKKGLYFLSSIAAFPTLKKTTDVKETARWEAKLKEKPKELYNETAMFVRNVVQEISKASIQTYETRASLGDCPKCKKGKIYAGKNNYYCNEYKNNGCDFGLWKETFGTTLPKGAINALLTGKTTKVLYFKRKDGSPFNAALLLDEDFKIAFAPRESRT